MEDRSVQVRCPRCGQEVRFELGDSREPPLISGFDAEVCSLFARMRSADLPVASGQVCELVLDAGFSAAFPISEQ